MVNIDLLVTQATYLQSRNLIDPLTNVENDKVFIFHGSEDDIIKPGKCSYENRERYVSSFKLFVFHLFEESGRNVEEMYTRFKAKIETEYLIPAQHGWVSISKKE